MRSKESISKLFDSLLYPAIFLISLLIVPHKTVLALPSLESMLAGLEQSANRICNPTLYQFSAIAEDQPQQSIVRFGYNYDTVRYLKTFYNILGVSIDNAVRCATVAPPIGFSALGLLCEAATGAPANPDNCAHFMLGYNAPSGGFADSPVSGSLLGLYYTLEKAEESSVPPLDVKYFAGRQLEKIPYLGTALAAPAYNTTPFVNDIYNAWKIVRNLSLSVFSLIVLGVGIMMINRSRVNPQTVVTIQYALPKIILSLVFIVFSYPIGAVICVFFHKIVGVIKSIILFQGLLTLGEAIIRDFFILDDTGRPVKVAVIKIVVYAIISITQAGIGMSSYLLALIITIVIFFQIILIMVKYFITYIKMVYEVLMSPASFAIYAIPGNDTKLIDWFKKMVAYGLSMIVLGAGPVLVLMVGLLVGYDAGIGTVDEPGFGTPMPSIWVSITLAFLLIFVGFGMLLKMPDKIMEAITGQKKR